MARHNNMYFKRKYVSLIVNEGLVVITTESLGRSQRRSQSQTAARERNESEKDTMQTLKSKDKRNSSGIPHSTQDNRGLQLFHISSLATTFGESYSYVAGHINSVFSRSFMDVQKEERVNSISPTRGHTRRLKKRQIPNTYIIKSKEDELSEAKSAADQPKLETNHTSSSWKEGYLHFAMHINKYFGANVAKEVVQDQKRRERIPVEMNDTSQARGAMSQMKQDEHIIHKTGGLFHSSCSTNIGDNYSQMAGHINQYFKGQSGSDEDSDRNLFLKAPDPGFASSERLKAVTFMDCLYNPTRAIPDLLSAYLNMGSFTQTRMPAVTSPETILTKKLVLSRRDAEDMTRGLIGALSQALPPEALASCVEVLNEHLIRYPSCKALMWQERTAVTLLRKRRTHRDNQALQDALRESLALIGYVDPVKGSGIRVLSIDGGGTRGVVPLQVLKLLEAQTGRRIHQLFDYICGVSTGAVLAFMLGLAQFSLEECADMYRRFGAEVFRQNPLVGTMKMGWSHSYYNTETWEAILREKLGNRVLIKTAGDESTPKVSAVSAVVNWGTSPKAFVFRNYNHKPGSLSRYAGGSLCEMWQAVRASSAAPGYFQEFPLQSDIHQDGGIILNNPCALAVHESRLLWPNQPFQCVLSLGTGRYDNAKRGPATSTSLRAKISNLISSATDTEGVHTLLDDLLAPDVYFRFNPTLSALVSLDESRPRAMDQLQRDTQDYLERNQTKVARLCLVLGAERSAASRTKDWMSERAWEMKQRWV
ncbi:calcium-independent phospholipase A2-gamma-like [Pungitius pungitius]|uniref:calcium-independent phospholipase A2-gamma-like n=1 Tax=Pungitius pungitius TaxID=134920 RepID=UPI002E14C43C